MKNTTEIRDITDEIAELMKAASKEQKVLIKGILLGANAAEKADGKKAG